MSVANVKSTPVNSSVLIIFSFIPSMLVRGHYKLTTVVWLAFGDWCLPVRGLAGINHLVERPSVVVLSHILDGAPQPQRRPSACVYLLNGLAPWHSPTASTAPHSLDGVLLPAYILRSCLRSCLRSLFFYLCCLRCLRACPQFL
jgi:hypothetical protein